MQRGYLKNIHFCNVSKLEFLLPKDPFLKDTAVGDWEPSPAPSTRTLEDGNERGLCCCLHIWWLRKFVEGTLHHQRNTSIPSSLAPSPLQLRIWWAPAVNRSPLRSRNKWSPSLAPPVRTITCPISGQSEML